ncbi:hypothetical protein GJU40_19130 [Bacillus lacus]|uniref:Uncharacterized protein n=1 Tax=Metabacillus lacus TaxID=1983721 RepID=A0A7X2M1F2_9BACI|nr:hypothetical protein [Metabacillus lacus]MRX74239.1 hypothetical protein [Metabacillus lacus]
MDGTVDIWNGIQSRYVQFKEEKSMSSFLHYITMGADDMVVGTVNPKEPYSAEHLLDSFGVFSFLAGGALAGTAARMPMGQVKKGLKVESGGQGSVERNVSVKPVSEQKFDVVEGNKSTQGTVKGENISPSENAKSWQGTFPYVGVDKYRNITLKKGKIIYVGEPYPTGYATTKSAVERINGDSKKLFEGLQVKPYWEDGMNAAEYRSKMVAYEIKENTDVAFGLTKANPQFGDGGLPQMFIPDFNELVKNGVIKKLEVKAFELKNYKMSLDEYYKMIDALEK